MVNLRFSNYKQFADFYMKANNSVRRILNRVYPEYRRKLQDDYISSIKKIGTTASKVTNKVKNTQAFNIAKGFKPTKLGTAGALWTMLDPRTPWNEKALGLGLMFPATAPYAAAGLATTALAPMGIDAYYDIKFKKDARYQGNPIENYFAGNLAPELKLSTEDKSRLKKNKKAEQKADTENKQSYSNTYTPSNSAYPKQPSFVQNTEQKVSKATMDTNIPTLNKSSIQSNLAPVQQINMNNLEAPDWRRFNAGVTTRLQDLYDRVYTPQTTEKENQMDNQAGYNALVNLVQASEANRQQQALQGSEILKQYQQALNRDRMINATNQAINALTAGVKKAPIAYVGAKGDLNTIELDQPTSQALLPTNVSSTATDYLNALDLQQKMVPQGNTELAQQALTASALGQQYGVDPLIFMNKDLAQEFMKGRNTLENTQMTGIERRKDIPLTTEQKVIEANAETAGNIALEQAKGYYDILNTQLQQAGLNARQANQIASTEAIAQYQQAMQNYREEMANKAAMERAVYSGRTQRDVARIYASRASGGQTKTTSPLEYAKTMAPVMATVYSIQNPIQRQQFINMVDPTGKLFSNSKGIAPSQFNTSVDEQAILNNVRNRR